MFDKVLLRSLRKEKGLSQADVAVAVGLTASAIGNYERGVHEPSRPTAKKLADYFGVDATSFWTELARPEPAPEVVDRPATQGDVLRAMHTLADAGAQFGIQKGEGPLVITASYTPTGGQLEKAAAQLAMLLFMRNQNAALGEDSVAAMQSSIDAWMDKMLPELDKLPLHGEALAEE